MSWPSPQDFLEAIQNPATNLGDAELRLCEIRVNKLGLPEVFSGRFASVFSGELQGRRIALRCFLGQYPERQRRYQAIAGRLAKVRSPHFVSFQYVEQGILVHEQWYPMLKMDWVDGLPFIAYLHKHREDKTRLLRFLRSWRQLSAHLHELNIAHGDIQSDNLLMCADVPVFVDYDGMYVPQLEGSKSAELGIVHFQHPRRNESDFGPHLDNFSFWLVYCSLVCLLADPELWALTDPDHKFLLFSGDDLKSPYSSKIFGNLGDHSSEEIRDAVGVLRSLLSSPLNDIVPLHRGKLPKQTISVDFDRRDLEVLGLQVKDLSTENLQEAYSIWKYVWDQRAYTAKEMRSKASELNKETEAAYASLREQLKAATSPE